MRRFVSIDELTDMISDAPSPEEQVMRKEEYIRVRNAMRRLDEPYKDVFILHVYAGISLKEIALVYEKSESWARVTYYRAKQKIIQEVAR